MVDAKVITNRAQLQRLSIAIPRTLYVNCRGPSAIEAVRALAGSHVKRDLPLNKPSSDLYEVKLSEKKFVKRDGALQSLLSDPQIEGIYESKTPLWFRGVLRLGCVSKVSKVNKKSSSFKLDDLDFLSINSHPYMDKTVCVFKRIFIYHVADRTRSSGNGVVALFVIEETNEEMNDSMTARAYVWISNGTGMADVRPPLKRIFRRFCSDERVDCKFVTAFTENLSKAFYFCNERLSLYLSERRGPTIAVAQGSISSRGWRKSIPQLYDFPLVCMPSYTTDEQFPALNWQLFVAERIIQRYLHFPEWFSDRVECARFAHIPLANLGVDVTMTMIDVLFARQLTHNRHLLWASEGTTPDLGGSELDPRGVWSEQLEEPTLNQPGAYRNVCVELEVR